jgi:hypothetical protein
MAGRVGRNVAKLGDLARRIEANARPFCPENPADTAAQVMIMKIY